MAAIPWLLMVTMGFAAPVQEPGWTRRVFGTLTWEEVPTVCKTPQEICSAVRHHVTYKEDLEERWASGMETWNNKSGDCKDFATCVIDLCKAVGIEAQMKIFCPKGSWVGHAVVIGQCNGRLWISSNGWYEEVESLDAAKAAIARELGWRQKEILTATPDEVKSGAFLAS